MNFANPVNWHKFILINLDNCNSFIVRLTAYNGRICVKAGIFGKINIV